MLKLWLVIKFSRTPMHKTNKSTNKYNKKIELAKLLMNLLFMMAVIITLQFE